MANQYRVPKNVVVESLSDNSSMAASVRDSSSLSFQDVVLMSATWQGVEGRAWSSEIVKRATNPLRLTKEIRVTETDEVEVTPDLPEELSELLADVFSFYLRAHGAHWNVTGTDFAEYHKLFGEIYEDVYSSVDPIAENLRKIGVVAPFQLPQLLALRTIGDSSVGQDARALAIDLMQANDFIIEEVAEAFRCATTYGQQGIANFLADRLDKHQFWKWQLTASLGLEVPASDEVVTEALEQEPVGEMYSQDVPQEMPVERQEDMTMIEERKSAIASAERLTFEAEVRAVATDDGSLRIGGYAAQFNKEATGLNFREMIAPGAFKRSLQSGDPVFLLVNHDTDQLPLASTQGGTLTLSEDEVGLRMEATLDPSNPRAAELASALTRGDVDKMSFAFSVAPGGDTREEGLRTLTDLNLFEVSVVTWPAYDASSVGMRSEDSDTDDLELRKRKIALKFKLDSL